MTEQLHDPILEEAIRIKNSILEGAEQAPTQEVPATSHWNELVDTRISEKAPMFTPQQVADAIPLTESAADTTLGARDFVEHILRHNDDKLLVIAGPCSIHSPESALQYAEWLANIRELYSYNLEIIMRAYMEKPRTEIGWKGLMNDPLLDESYDLDLGVVLTRLVASKITQLGVPIAMERLGMRTPQYLNGLVAYDAIGARNTTDQNAREYASASSSPVGFKNTPEGSIKAAAEAAGAAAVPHIFPGTAPDGRPMRIASEGNPYGHIILRGSHDGPNYSVQNIEYAATMLEERGLSPAVLVDVSHGNSNKDYTRQTEVIRDVCEILATGQYALRGVMIESNIVSGKQELKDPAELVYGQSITDGCVDLDETEDMLAMLAEAVQKRDKANPNPYPVMTVM